MIRPNLLFADDELFFAQPYIDKLIEKCDITIKCSALDVLNEYRVNTDKYSCSILDIMMPSPDIWAVKTSDGLDTGIEILREASDVIVQSHLPVLVLTSRALPYVKGQIEEIGFPKDLIIVRSKIETPTFLASILVSQLIKQWKGIIC